MGRRNDLACVHCQPATPTNAANPCPQHQHRVHVKQHPTEFHYAGRGIDWGALHGVDFETLVADVSRGDGDAFERCLSAGLLDGSLHHDPAATPNNLLHFARLAQFGLQYLRNQLDTTPSKEQDELIKSLENELRRYSDITFECNQFANDLSESHNRGDAYQQAQTGLLNSIANHQRSLERHQQRVEDGRNRLAQLRNDTDPSMVMACVQRLGYVVEQEARAAQASKETLIAKEEQLDRLHRDKLEEQRQMERLTRRLQDTEANLRDKIQELQATIRQKDKQFDELWSKNDRCCGERHEHKIYHLKREVERLLDVTKHTRAMAEHWKLHAHHGGASHGHCSLNAESCLKQVAGCKTCPCADFSEDCHACMDKQRQLDKLDCQQQANHSQRLFHPKCCVCFQFLPVEANGKASFTEFLLQDKACPKHHSDGTHSCNACARLCPRGQSWPEVRPGRRICLDCLDTVVVDTVAAQPLYEQVLDFFASHTLGYPEPPPGGKQPPLMLVDSEDLAIAHEREGDTHTPHQGDTRGLCLSKTYQNLHTAVRSPAGNFWESDLHPTAVQLTGLKVTGLLVICGLPSLLLSQLVAHEVMHAWLRLNGYVKLPAEVEEGLCQLMAWLWLKQKATKPKDMWEERLCYRARHQIQFHTCPVYGGGFRQALPAFQKFGLSHVLKFVKEHSAFPA